MQNSQSKVTFQLDTGAECNLLSLKDYRRVTADEDLTQLKRSLCEMSCVMVPILVDTNPCS